MDIVLKKVSVRDLILLRLSLESLINRLEIELADYEKGYNSSSKFSKDFYRLSLKERKDDLIGLRNLYKQL